MTNIMASVRPPSEWLRPANTTFFEGPNCCIYCLRNVARSDEHIIPYWMAGGFILRDASCLECAKITGRFEGELSNTTFFALRTRFKFQSRSSKRNKKNNVPSPTFELIALEDGVEVKKSVLANELPPVFASIHFPPPGILVGRVPLPALRPSDFPIKISIKNISGYSNVKGTLNGKFKIPVNSTSLMRLAAKIAHGFMFTSPILGDFVPLLRGSILTGHYVSYFVGSPEDTELAGSARVGGGHHISVRNITIPKDNVFEYLIVTVRLFSDFGGPVFDVIAARRRLAKAAAVPTPLYVPEIYGVEGKFEPFNVWIDAKF